MIVLKLEDYRPRLIRFVDRRNLEPCHVTAGERVVLHDSNKMKVVPCLARLDSIVVNLKLG